MNDLLIDDIFFKTNSEEYRIPYEVLCGIRSLKVEDEPVRNWLWQRYQIKIEYLYKGRCISVEHGHYLEGVILYITKEVILPTDVDQVKQGLLRQFSFRGIDSAEHKEWGITPQEAISFVRLEDQLREQVDHFIYNLLKQKAKQLGASLQFTCFEFARRLNQEYEYRVCYPNENELKKHNDNGDNQAFRSRLETLIRKNNYFGIYDAQVPAVRFIVR